MTCLTVVDFRSKFLIVGTIDVRREALKGLFPLSRHVGSVSRGDQTVERIWIFHRSFFFSFFLFFFFFISFRTIAKKRTMQRVNSVAARAIKILGIDSGETYPRAIYLMAASLELISGRSMRAICRLACVRSLDRSTVYLSRAREKEDRRTRV